MSAFYNDAADFGSATTAMSITVQYALGLFYTNL